MLLLACIGFAGSFATIRQRRLASPTSILEIEATHPLVNVPCLNFSFYSPAVRPHPRVVIVGSGFGGLQCAKALRGEPVDVLLVDRQNYHLFTPLLYQVASCLLNPSEVAAPLRKVLRGAPNVRYRQGDVTDADFERKQVRLSDGTTLEYDMLVLATGSVTNYYGNDAIESEALGLKDLGEALQLRNHVLECLERAAATADSDERRRLLTFCIVGGGPTGVEFAGALAELVRLVLPHEYPEFPPSDVRIVLLEGGERVLPTFKARLSDYARRELRQRGVDVRTKTLVASADDRGVVMRDGTELPTASIVWTAGVRPTHMSVHPEVTHTEQERFTVDGHLRVLGAEDVYAIGDVAAAPDRAGRVLPMLSAPAMQAGRYVAREIARGPTRTVFRYRDKGTMATIGRRAAVAQMGPIQLTGELGWVAWLVVHLYYLIGFENRLRVMFRWAWYYLRLDRPVRSILRADPSRAHAQIGRPDR
jgi:NADH dehydrogenase